MHSSISFLDSAPSNQSLDSIDLTLLMTLQFAGAPSPTNSTLPPSGRQLLATSNNQEPLLLSSTPQLFRGDHNSEGRNCPGP